MIDRKTRQSTLAGAGALAITGSKGGVGKSNLVLNLAVSLGRWGRRVLLIDGDLGLANIDVLLGLMPKHTVEHLVRGEAELRDVLMEGPAGIRVLPAASGVPSLARLDADARQRLLVTLSQTATLADDVLVDTGAGLGDAQLAFQLAAARVVLVTTPEPTSLVDAYATLKVLWSADPAKPVVVVVNAARDEDEARRAYEQIARASAHFLGHEPGWLGAVYRDPKLPEAVSRQRSLVELFPDCPAAGCYERIAMRLASMPGADLPIDEYWRRLMEPVGEELTN
jgi:flagellar biosynthesis protein FlhG